MPNVTALELVNRILVFHKFTEVTDFSDAKSRAALLLVNQAIDKVLNTNDWEFARRHDGVLITSARQSFSSPDVATFDTSNSSQIAIDGSQVLESPSGSPTVLRFVNEDDTTMVETNVSYIVDTWQQDSILGVPFTGVGFSSPCLASTGTTNDFLTYAAEYILPTTVRGMISATKQNSGRLDVEMVSPELRLEELSTEPQGNVSDYTRIIYQGGSAIATDTGSTNGNDYGLRVIVWPIPESRFKVDYSYWYLYPQLAATTDEIEGISHSAIHDVVNWAYAQSNLTGIGNDPKLGAALKQDTRYEVNETRRAEKAAMSYDGRITPWGSIPRGHPGSRNPRWRWESQRIEGL